MPGAKTASSPAALCYAPSVPVHSCLGTPTPAAGTQKVFTGMAEQASAGVTCKLLYTSPVALDSS